MKAIRNSNDTNTASLKEIFKDADWSTNPNVIHISPSENRWRVRREGSVRAIARLNTIGEAKARAKSIPNVERIVIHGKNGRIKKHIVL